MFYLIELLNIETWNIKRQKIFYLCSIFLFLKRCGQQEVTKLLVRVVLCPEKEAFPITDDEYNQLQSDDIYIF